MRRTFLVMALIFLLSMGGIGHPQKKVETKMIDGIPHVMNPKKPLRGTVQLEVEKTLEINPYVYEQFGLRYFTFVRDSNGDVILYNSDIVEAQRFNNRGEHLGSLVRKGQGPGEFSDFGFFKVFFTEAKIVVTGNRKLARFDKTGRFLEEEKTGERSVYLVNENSFITENSRPDEKGMFVKIVFVELPTANDAQPSKTTLFEAAGVGMIKVKNGGFDDEYVTPNIRYAFDNSSQTIYLVHNKEYKIHAKNLKGDRLRIIERSYRTISLSREGRKKLLSKFKGGDIKSLEAAYPDELVAIKDIKVLPCGWLAVYRITGAELFKIDVFNPEGKYIYILEPPKGISLEEAVFHEKGFSLVEEKGEVLVYSDYRVKNLATIFRCR
jgi:hypothetical protein